MPFLAVTALELDGEGMNVGTQSIGLEEKGVFAGDTAVSMARSLGCDHSRLGHS